MNLKILYCEKCGKVIPPEEAEAEDFAALGGVPTCPKCLEQADPHRKKQFDTVRLHRLNLREQERQALGIAKPPQQTFPAPGTELPPEATSAEIRSLREEFAAEWRQEKGLAAPPGKIAQAPPSSPFPFETEQKIAWLGTAEGAKGLEGPGGPKGPIKEEKPDAGRESKWSLFSWVGIKPALGLLLLGLSLSALAFLAWPPSSGSGLPAPVRGPAPSTGPAHEASPVASNPQLTAENPAPEAKEREPFGQQQIKDIETIVLLTGEDPEVSNAIQALVRLKPLAVAGEQQARAAAVEALAKYEALIDSKTRQVTRGAAERARELEDEEQFTESGALLQKTLEALPEASPWARQAGRRQVRALLETLQERKLQRLAQAIAKIEALAVGGDAEAARIAAEKMQRHSESDFRKAAEQYLERLLKTEAESRIAQRRQVEAARAAWAQFFHDFDVAFSNCNWERADALCRPVADSPLRTGGIENPEEVLTGFGAEIQGAKNLYDAALRAARTQIGRPIALPLATENIQGTLKEVENHDLITLVESKAELRIAIERLTPVGMELLLELAKDPDRAAWQPALWSLRVTRGAVAKADAASFLLEKYKRLSRPVPAHWAKRFQWEKQQETKLDLAQKLDNLKKALETQDLPALRNGLDGLKPLLADGNALSAAELELVTTARQKAGRVQIKQILFQNGSHPQPEYVGIQADQINRYYKNAERTDVDIHHGMKVGSFNDLQRVLLRFDGLEASLGRSRVLKATLELYQLEGPKPDGASVALYRLKKPWMPDAGTWVNADQRRKVAWQKPGASGPEDAAAKPEAQVRFDGQLRLWRSWDVTAYIREVVEGKTPNLGLLLKVVEDEPRFTISFYPDSDLEGEQKDTALRPRLVVECETVGE